ncbi:DEAD-box ATP-dependent RNA helicase [Perilla frutescens var. hirtella]|nr:DEAD-box ATP-dependent RNA helicase [Perilla frutescens var. hirtella]KAH6817190.1 DEAD-box ATP-dependent RNA helicase [Perilla frutescens var. frutescens]
MADPKSDPSSNSPSGKNVKAPNLFERAKEEFEAVLHNGKQRHEHHKETHGLRDDIDVDTPTSDVKAPNVFERAKEEIEAIVEAIHPKKESKTHDPHLYGETTRSSVAKDCMKSEKSDLQSEKNVKAPPKLIVKAEEGMESLKHKPHHHKETHGRSDDIDENTPISEVKGPNVFERAKEEIEALIETIHPKKDSGGGGRLPK